MSKFNSFVAEVHNGGHNLGSDVIKVFLTNSAPAAGNTVLANITEVSYTNCSDRTVTVTSSAQSGGVYSFIVDDLTLTASGGDVGPFTHYGLYNDTSTGDKLICYYAIGASTTIVNGNSLVLNFDNVNGVFQTT